MLNNSGGQLMPASSQSDLTATYQAGGNRLATTALLTAVSPTPKVEAIFARPMASAMLRVFSIQALYPPLVDLRKPTIGGLPKISPMVDIDGMEDRPDYSIIGQRLAAMRIAFSDLNQTDWALKNGFGVTQYNNWEKGTRRISVDAAEVLVDRYGVTLDYIYRGRVDGLSEKAAKAL